MTAEMSDLLEGMASNPLLNEDFEILAGLEPAVSARVPDDRWAKPGIEEPL